MESKFFSFTVCKTVLFTLQNGTFHFAFFPWICKVEYVFSNLKNRLVRNRSTFP